MTHGLEFDALLRLWRRIPTRFARGLREREIDEIESHYGLTFPPDLRVCLADRLPVGLGFPNWRKGELRHRIWNGSIVPRTLEWWLDGVRSGLVFDVHQSGFWYSGFGPRPEDSAERQLIAERYLETKVPKLIPVYGHRCLPTRPSVAGNPVFSVSQMDVIYYGEDLQGYLEIEFFGRPHSSLQESRLRTIDFWTDIVEMRNCEWEVP